MAGPSTGSAADLRSIKSKRVFAEQPEKISMDADDDNEINLIYNMDVNPVSSESNPLLYALSSIIPLDEVLAEIPRIEKEEEDRKKRFSNMLLKILLM